MRYLRSLLSATLVITAFAGLTACSSLSPNPQWTISKIRPENITPMVRIEPIVPEIAAANKALPSGITVCFKVESNGRPRDVSITRIAIPKMDDKKLAHKIEVALGSSVQGAVEQSLFFPQKIQGKPVETSHVCEDYMLHSP